MSTKFSRKTFLKGSVAGLGMMALNVCTAGAASAAEPAAAAAEDTNSLNLVPKKAASVKVTSRGSVSGGWQGEPVFPNWKGYVDETLAMNHMYTFVGYAGQGTLCVEPESGVTGFNLFVNNRQINTAAMAAGGVEPSAGGPGLMFVYLVNVFNGMPGGRIVGMVFFICVLFAGVSSIVNLYEAPVAFLQEKLHLKRAPAVATIGVIGFAVSIMIQPWTSQWMDLVSIYICPLGALLAGIMFFWVLRKETVLNAVNEGREKAIGGWFYPLGKYVYCIAALVALIAGAVLGGIG